MTVTKRYREEQVKLEQILLGLVLQEPTLISRLEATGVRTEHFSSAHQAVYKACLDCYLNNEVPTTNLLVMRLGSRDPAKATAYLKGLRAKVSDDEKGNVSAYASKFLDMVRRSQLGDLANKVLQELEAGTATRKLESSLVSVLLGDDGPQGNTGVLLREGLVNHLNELHVRTLTAEEDDYKRTPTGYPSLDRPLNGGFRKGTLTYVGARPGNGKTTILLNMALNAAIRGIPAVFFTYEMPMDELLGIYLSMLSERLFPNRGVASSFIDNPDTMELEDWKKLLRTIEKLKDIPLYLEDCDGDTIHELAMKATKYAHRGVDSFYVDYWQLIRLPSGRLPVKEYEFGETSEELRRLSKRLDGKFVVGAQVKRENELREVKQPQASDLRNSGKAEQDAQVIITLHFPEKYAPSPDACERPNEIDVAIVKNRRGELTLKPLYFKKQFGLLEEMSPVGLTVPGRQRRENVITRDAKRRGVTSSA